MAKRIILVACVIFNIYIFHNYCNAEPIPDNVLKCVGFLTVPVAKDIVGDIDEFKTIGTAFFVGHVYPQKKDKIYIFLVTAKHVLFHEDGSRIDNVLLRLNDKKTGKMKDLNILKNSYWFFHPDKSVDLAIHPLVPKGADYLFIPDNFIVSDNMIRNNKIGLGDEIFYLGLLDYYSGLDHIVPIARFGKIALVTEEKTANGMAYYFIDAGNIPGHSGSPVFLWATPSRTPSEIVAGARIFGLYGVVSALIQYPSPIKIIMPKNTKSSPIPISLNPGGITAIVPYRYLIELLNNDMVTSFIGIDK